MKQYLFEKHKSIHLGEVGYFLNCSTVSSPPQISLASTIWDNSDDIKFDFSYLIKQILSLNNLNLIFLKFLK